MKVRFRTVRDDLARAVKGAVRTVKARQAEGTRGARREAERARALFFQLSPQLQCVIGRDGHFKIVNPAWSTILGWSSEELVSRPWTDFVDAGVREPASAVTAPFADRLPVVGHCDRHRCRDGSWRWLEWQAASRLEQGNVYAVANDITETRATKEALRVLSESLATTLNSIGDGVIATDLQGRVTRMNPVAEELTGWAFAEAEGRSLVDVLPLFNAETRETVDNPIDRTLAEGATVKLPNHTLLAQRSGLEIPIADSCAPILDGHGRVNGAVFVFRDLTSQRNAEANQAKLQKQLVFADRMAAVGTLAAGVAHEINNPLTFVMANVETAIETVGAMARESPSRRIEELEEILREARQGVARVTAIVGALKAFSRIEEERLSAIDVVPVMDLAIRMTGNEIRHRARLVKDYGPVPLVQADGARLGQVFINLLANAAHAFPNGDADASEIRVVIATDARGRAVVEVHDTGVGIPAPLLGRIFDPFFTTKPVGCGTGLGLAISYSIVTGMNGELSVQSEVGRGTTLRVVLPPSSSDALPKAEVNGHSRTGPVRAAQVLVVDDEKVIGLAIRRVLAAHDVTVVATAQGGLDLLAAGKDFDIVLSDLMMPGMSGMQLYREVLELYPKMAPRVVFLTGGAFTPEARAFLDAVGNERVDKPFDSGALRTMVQRFADARDLPEGQRRGTTG